MKEDIRNEIIRKAGFPLYVDYWEKYFSQMSGEQVKECLKIIFHFNLTFEVLESKDLAVKMVINTVIDNLKRDAEKRIKQSKASRQNGALGGRPPKPNRNPQKPKKTQLVINIYDELTDGLKFILEAKLNRKLNTNSWKKQIELLVEKDLSERANAVEDVKRAMQEVANRFGEQYFPVIQSAAAFREKFSKIETAIQRNNGGATNSKNNFKNTYLDLREKFKND